MKIIIFNIIFIFCLVTFSFAGNGEYNYITTTNGNNTTTTYTDNNTNTTYGSRGYITGNTIRTDSNKHSITSKSNNNITTHTYTDKSTGAVTGGSTIKQGNTTYNYGSSPPYPYKYK